MDLGIAVFGFLGFHFNFPVTLAGFFKAIWAKKLVIVLFLSQTLDLLGGFKVIVVVIVQGALSFADRHRMVRSHSSTLVGLAAIAGHPGCEIVNMDVLHGHAQVVLVADGAFIGWLLIGHANPPLWPGES
jgi:hypothetical protein